MSDTNFAHAQKEGDRIFRAGSGPTYLARQAVEWAQAKTRYWYR